MNSEAKSIFKTPSKLWFYLLAIKASNVAGSTTLGQQSWYPLLENCPKDEDDTRSEFFDWYGTKKLLDRSII